MSSVRLQGVTKRYGQAAAVDRVDLEIKQGEFVTILGASGSGKTTCLRMVAGFIAPTEGSIFFGSNEVTRIAPYRRNTGMVFQQYALFPHLTVWENIAFGLKIRRVPSQEIAQRTNDALRLVHLSDLSKRYPHQLSGGQRQRVALARAVVIRPDILLLDEPLAALDLKLREELQTEIKRVQSSLGITTLFVTHDQDEALSMSDRVVVMRDGRVLQVDSPNRLYEQPADRYVANFVGRTNFIEGVVAGGEPDSGRYRVRLASDAYVAAPSLRQLGNGERCLIGFRPEAARFGDGEGNQVQVKVHKVAYFGSSVTVECLGPQQEAVSVDLSNEEPVPAVDSTAMIYWPVRRTMIFGNAE